MPAMRDRVESHLRAASLLLLAGLAACGQPAARTAPEGVVTFEVQLAESGAELGEDAPLPFDPDPDSARTFHVTARAVGADGATVTSYTGPARLRAVPARLSGSDEISFVSGVAENVPVSIYAGYGDVRIWVEDTGEVDAPGTYATGVSPAIRFALPTAAELQRTTSSLTSRLDGENVTVRTEDRELIVTGIAQDGFYVTDVSEPDGAFASIFAFSFNRPDDLSPGDRIVSFNGNVYEYLGFTELQYPTWKVSGSGNVPAPTRIDEALCSEDPLDLERHESALVEVGRLVSAFDDGDLEELCASYREYGQWPARLEGASCAKLMVVNQYTVPDLKFDACLSDPPTLPETIRLDGLRGHLRQNQYADYSEWILEVSGCEDLVDPEDRARWCPDEDLAARTAAHYSGPRPAPKAFRREHPDCSGVPYPLHDD